MKMNKKISSERKALILEEAYASCKAGIDFSNYTSLRFQGSRSAIFFAL